MLGSKRLKYLFGITKLVGVSQRIGFLVVEEILDALLLLEDLLITRQEILATSARTAELLCLFSP